jgi:hypothetical protein
MALPPHSLGTRVRTVRLESVDARRWRVSVDDRRLSPTFASEAEARGAGAAEAARLDAIALALLRRVRSRSSRKRS